jgi:hypothetical protein
MWLDTTALNDVLALEKNEGQGMKISFKVLQHLEQWFSTFLYSRVLAQQKFGDTSGFY